MPQVQRTNEKGRSRCADTFRSVIPSEPERRRRRKRNPENVYPAKLIQGISALFSPVLYFKIPIDDFKLCHVERLTRVSRVEIVNEQTRVTWLAASAVQTHFVAPLNFLLSIYNA